MAASFTFEQLRTRVINLNKQTLGPTDPDRKTDWDSFFDNELLDPCIAGFALFDRNFVLQRSNGIYAKFLRENTPYGIERAVGMSYFDLAPGSVEGSGMLLRHVMESARGTPRYNVKLNSIHNRNYVVSYWNEHMSPLVDDRGKVIGSVVCYIDVTEKVIAQKSDRARDVFSEDDHGPHDVGPRRSPVPHLLDDYKFEWQYKFIRSIKDNIYPRINDLKHTSLDRKQKACLQDIECFLDDMIQVQPAGEKETLYLLPKPRATIAPTARSRESTDDFSKLTPAEAKVAQWVERGRSSKEIAFILGVSKRCVDFHRNNIRKKLNLTERKVNLSGYLRSLQG